MIDTLKREVEHDIQREGKLSRFLIKPLDRIIYVTAVKAFVHPQLPTA